MRSPVELELERQRPIPIAVPTRESPSAATEMRRRSSSSADMAIADPSERCSAIGVQRGAELAFEGNRTVEKTFAGLACVAVGESRTVASNLLA